VEGKLGPAPCLWAFIWGFRHVALNTVNLLKVYGTLADHRGCVIDQASEPEAQRLRHYLPGQRPKEAEMKHMIVGRRGADCLVLRVAAAIEELALWSDRGPQEE
jgi:hypothetical protein